MNDEVYHRLAKVLDTLPNGFPSTESGIEIRILKKIFRPEQADLCGKLRLTFETAEQIAERTGVPLEGLEDKLVEMASMGQIWMIDLGTRFFRLLPWVFGIFEFQLGRLDRELSEMAEEYGPAFGRAFNAHKPQFMKTVAVEETVPSRQEALPYERVSAIIETGQSFFLNNCICKKEHALLGKPCSRPMDVCLAIAPVPGVFKDTPDGRVISKEEAYAVIKKAEEVGLVHLTGNMQAGHFFICNCCKCCCGPLRAINDLGLPAWEVINSRHYAVIDQEACIGCGVCTDERCQVNAIEAGDDDTYQVVSKKCIGCGLCVGTCPVEAIRLEPKTAEELDTPPLNEQEWFREKGRARGIDFSKYE